MGYEGWKWECRKWSHELGTFEARWSALGKWEFTAARGPGEEGRDVNIYVVEYRYLIILYV
jgi:hypothetical protein